MMLKMYFHASYHKAIKMNVQDDYRSNHDQMNLQKGK